MSKVIASNFTRITVFAHEGGYTLRVENSGLRNGMPREVRFASRESVKDFLKSAPLLSAKLLRAGEKPS